MINKALLALICITASFHLMSQDRNQMDVNVYSHEKTGEIFLAIFTDKEGWLEKSKVYKGYKIRYDGDPTTITIEIPSEPFAISIFHDLNDNDEMDTNWMGIPKEPYGFSNDAMGAFGPPDFEESLINAEANNSINIHLR